MELRFKGALDDTLESILRDAGRPMKLPEVVDSLYSMYGGSMGEGFGSKRSRGSFSRTVKKLLDRLVGEERVEVVKVGGTDYYTVT